MLARMIRRFLEGENSVRMNRRSWHGGVFIARVFSTDLGNRLTDR